MSMHTEETGKNFNKRYLFSGFFQILAWGMFMVSSMTAAIHLEPDFSKKSEIYKNTRVENIENVFNITQKLLREHSEEILNVRSLDYSSPSWTRSTLFNDNVIKWATVKVCV